jgi:hypothetical protein
MIDVLISAIDCHVRQSVEFCVCEVLCESRVVCWIGVHGWVSAKATVKAKVLFGMYNDSKV